MFKRFVGFVLSKYSDCHDNSAFNMKFETPLQIERATAFMNYYIDPNDTRHIIALSSEFAKKEVGDIKKRYIFYTTFYRYIWVYKWRKFISTLGL